MSRAAQFDTKKTNNCCSTSHPVTYGNKVTLKLQVYYDYFEKPRRN